MRKILLRLVYHLCRMLRPRPNAAAETFLILQYRLPLGCCVHGTPIYAALKATHPDCTVVVATYGLGKEVLTFDPHIDHLIDIGAPDSGLGELLTFANLLRSRLHSLGVQPTQVLQDASNRRGTLAFLALLLRLAPIRGFADLPELYDDHLSYDATRSLIANNLRLVRDAPATTGPAIYFSRAELATARTLLAPTSQQASPLVALIVQGSGAQPNSWHDDRFASVIQYVESTGCHTIYLGTSAESADIDRIRTLAHSTGTSLAGCTDVPTLAAVLCQCDYVISVDTGSMHVARAAGTPMIVLGPSWQPAIEWLPLDVANATVLRGPDMNVARENLPADYRLDEIEAADVIAAFQEIARTYPFSSAARDQRIHRLLANA